MERREITDLEWPAVFDQFSRLHHGQKADVEIIDPNGQMQTPSQGVPLQGVTTEQGPGGSHAVDIMAGELKGAHVRHSVNMPRRVWLSEWNDGVSAILEIESADGDRTLVRIGPADQTLPPGMITDGFYERRC
jgi:hypothetical protein